MDQTGLDVIFQIYLVQPAFAHQNIFFHYYLQMCPMSGDSETNAHGRREVRCDDTPYPMM